MNYQILIHVGLKQPMSLVGGVVINLIIVHVHFLQNTINYEKGLHLWDCFVHGIVPRHIILT